ncbi:hypothetical protein HBB16_07500 [Pseudonocardia sp. MCCB 268]|nr:hypothetical protein [Pseudonocardia cytotoxica]
MACLCAPLLPGSPTRTSACSAAGQRFPHMGHRVREDTSLGTDALGLTCSRDRFTVGGSRSWWASVRCWSASSSAGASGSSRATSAVPSTPCSCACSMSSSHSRRWFSHSSSRPTWANIPNLIIAISCVLRDPVPAARASRGARTLSVRERDYVLSARLAGARASTSSCGTRVTPRGRRLAPDLRAAHLRDRHHHRRRH